MFASLLRCNKSSPPAGGGPGSQKTILHEEQWKMPALPALLLSIHFLFLLLTMAPHSFSQAPAMSAVKMGKSDIEMCLLSLPFAFSVICSSVFLPFFGLFWLSLSYFSFSSYLVKFSLFPPSSVRLSLSVLHTECLSSTLWHVDTLSVCVFCFLSKDMSYHHSPWVPVFLPS